MAATHRNFTNSLLPELTANRKVRRSHTWRAAYPQHETYKTNGPFTLQTNPRQPKSLH